MPEIYMTRAGYEKLVKELEMLRERKQALSKEIGETREQGDLRENAGYHYARERQSETLRRISEIETRISGAKIIDDMDLPKDQVIIGMKVIFMPPPRLSFRGKFATSLLYQCIKGYCRIQVMKTKKYLLSFDIVFLLRWSIISHTQDDK